MYNNKIKIALRCVHMQSSVPALTITFFLFFYTSSIALCPSSSALLQMYVVARSLCALNQHKTAERNKSVCLRVTPEHFSELGRD